LANKLAGKLKRIRYFRNRRWNSLIEVKPLGRVKPFFVDEANLLLPRDRFVRYLDALVTEYGVRGIWRARYVSNIRGVHRASVRQSVGPEVRKVTVIFPRKDSYLNYEMDFDVVRAETLTCTGEIRWRGRIDSQVKNYEIGLFDDRYKPVDQYPVPGADNTELDLVYDFRVQNLIYPEPLLDRTRIEGMEVEYEAGFVEYRGKMYRNPHVDAQMRFRWEFHNDRDKPLTLVHWGMPLSVLYEDNLHCSQINVDITFPDRTVDPRKSVRYEFTTVIPLWAYGRVSLAHAVNVYEDGLLRYSGGPFYCFEVFRIVLP